MKEKRAYLKWKRVKGAEGYIVSYKNFTTGQVKKKRLKGNPKTSYIKYILKKLDYCTAYEVNISAYKGDAVGPVSKTAVFKTVLTKPEPPTVRIVTRDMKKTIIEWDPVKKADHYEVYMKKDREKTFLKKTKKTTFSIKNLNKLEKYTFLVKAVRHVEGCKPRKSKNGSVIVFPEDISYYNSLIDQVDDGNVYEGGGNPDRTYSDEVLEAYVNYGNNEGPYLSGTNYLLWCNRRSYRLLVFEKRDGKWDLTHSWPCIIGRGSNPTIRGIYTLSQVSTYHDYGGNHAEYLTSYSGDNMIHSLLFPTQSNYLSRGYMSSLGCIRITRENAAFVYNNCAGSTFIIR